MVKGVKKYLRPLAFYLWPFALSILPYYLLNNIK